MKKAILFLMAFVTTFLTASCWNASTTEPENIIGGGVTQMVSTNPLLCLQEDVQPSFKLEKLVVIEVEQVEEAPVEQEWFCDDIPLTYDEQSLLRAACEEFDVPYALALGLIEKETDFRNIAGDNGASAGYMQIQEKWHRDRMERLGVTDLFDPEGNFRVGLDLLSELYRKYGDWSMALTVYNMGHNPGYISDYAKKVIGNYAYWQELLENFEYERIE